VLLFLLPEILGQRNGKVTCEETLRNVQSALDYWIASLQLQSFGFRHDQTGPCYAARRAFERISLLENPCSLCRPGIASEIEKG
jgi:hypothetical protein